MEHTSLNDDAEFRLPPEFLTDDDFLVEKENNLFKRDDSNLFRYELSHGFGLDSGFTSTARPTCDVDSYLTGFTRQMVHSSPEDDFSCGFRGNYAFQVSKGCGSTRSPGAVIGGYGRPTRVSSQAAAWDLYCAAAEELAKLNIRDQSYGYNNHGGGGIPDDGAGYYSRQSLQYHKLQALKFQQLKQQQQLMQQRSRGLKANNNNKKTAGHVDLSLSAWSTQPQRRDGSGMRAVFLTGKSKSTGTGVFLPRRVDHIGETREKPTLATVLVPDRVAEVLNLDESLVQRPPVIRSSASLYEASWRQKSNNGGFSSQMKMEQGVNEPRLPSDWAY